MKTIKRITGYHSYVRNEKKWHRTLKNARMEIRKHYGQLLPDDGVFDMHGERVHDDGMDRLF
uniref:Uncharacterized protein n=1 Tax=viral metagenome TaxID=1070528 RepID=A0A6M3XXM9_9ZZZZ